MFLEDIIFCNSLWSGEKKEYLVAVKNNTVEPISFLPKSGSPEFGSLKFGSIGRVNLMARLSQMAMVGVSVLALSACSHLGSLNSQSGTKATNTNSSPQTLAGSVIGNQIVRGPRVVPYSTPRQSYDRSNPQSISGQNPSLGTVPFAGSPLAGTNPTASATPPKIRPRKVDAYVAPLPLPQFIDAVYGGMLKTPYVTGKNIAKRTDVVQLRSSGSMKSADFQILVANALEEYGVRVIPENNAYKIVEDKALRAQMPKFIKSRARVSTPQQLRPVLQFVELTAIDAGTVTAILQQAFGRNNQKIKFQPYPRQNYITLAGLPEDVDAALEIIREMDELSYAGAQVRRYTPRYWNAEELSSALNDALITEGWQVSDNKLQIRTIALMPVKYSNDLFVFAKSAQAHKRVSHWLKELDRPVAGGDVEQFYIYQVRNVDATILAETANSVLSSKASGGSSRSGASSSRTIGAGRQNAERGTTGIDEQGGGDTGFFTVDSVGNRIIFTGTASEYDRLVLLLEQLDTPAPEVLIELKIAEVSLTDESSFGVEFFVDDLGGESVQLTGQTAGLGLGGSGFNIGLLSGNIDAAINAFASNRRVKVLSTPSLMARSGGIAEIQVGQDVPVITSQRAANNQSGSANTDILQSIEYRKTGVLLSVEPIVFSDNRIDLTLSQEVSSTLATSNSSISSPTISNRSISTQLSLEDGQTAVLGGLIQENFIKDDKGVPILKDIPFIGQAFSVDGLSSERTELVILITAYVMRGQEDRSRFVRHMTKRVDAMMFDDSRLVTLLPKKF